MRWSTVRRARPAFEPGTVNVYHALTFGYLVGEIVRRTAGVTIGEVVQRDIASPLGLDGCYIGVPADELAVVPVFAADSSSDDGDGRTEDGGGTSAAWKHSSAWQPRPGSICDRM